MDAWLELDVVRDILGVDYDTLKKRIQRGKFTQIRQIQGHREDGKSKGRGGKVWQIHIDDPAIPAEAREQWKKDEATRKFNSLRESGADPSGFGVAGCSGVSGSIGSAKAEDEEAGRFLQALGLPDNEGARAVIRSVAERQKNVAKNLEEIRTKKELDLAMFSKLPEKRQNSAQAKEAILKSCTLWLSAGGFKAGSPKGVELFVKEYNSRRIDVDDAVIEAVPKTSRRSLFRWRTLYNEGGLPALADDYKSNEGKTILTREQQDIAVSMQVKFPGCSHKRVVEALEARGIPASVDSVRRFVKRWLKMNASMHLFLTNPDEWKNRHQLAFGNASETVTRLNQVWEMDSTPGDIMLTDGRFTVIGCIDVYSRRLRLLVSPTSKAVAVASLIRRAIIEWGVAESIKTDNGQDYVAAHIERVLEGLEIDHVLCPPFTPEAKPHIERSFHTFSHGIVELLPGFIGHSVSDRKAIEARKAFSERLMKRGAEVEVKLTSLEFQKICDRWVDAAYMHDSHSGLGGRSPVEMVREWTAPVRTVIDERALDILLHPAPGDGGYRFVGKKGIRVDGRYYISPALAEWSGERVSVRVDDTDLGHAVIYAESGAFVCVAECPEWRGVSPADLANHARARQKAIMLEQKKELKELVRRARIDTIPEEILAYREERIATVTEFPKQTVPYVTPALEEAAKAVLERDALKAEKKAPQHIELPPEVLEYEKKRDAKVASLAEARKMKDVTSPVDIYYLILKRIVDGVVTPYEMKWKEAYEHWSNTGKKVGIFRDDQYCLRDPGPDAVAAESDGTSGV